MRYTSTTKYIDIDTGEQISTRTAKQHYKTIKTRKNATTKWNEGTCYIEYTKLCRRDQQGKLFK